MTESETTTVRVKNEDKKTWDEFLVRTSTSGIDAFHLIMAELQKLLDLMTPNKRLLWMADMDSHGSNRMVHIRLSDNLDSSLAEIPQELHDQIKKEFGYGPNFEDLREKPEHLTHAGKIQAQHDAELEAQKGESS